MTVSIILIGYNSWHYLEENLAALASFCNDSQTEIIYVDNASADGTVSKINELYPFVKVLTNKTNKGISVARNQGLKIASGDYLWILDSDTVPTKEAFDVMITFMGENCEVGLCGCKMYGQDGTVQDSCRPFPSIKLKLKAAKTILLKKLHLSKKMPSAGYYNKNREKPFEVDYVIGACQLIRRDAFEKAGYLDENIFYGPEDADYCLRINQAGYKVYYLPQVSIYHAYQRVSSHRLFSKINRMHVLGLAYYFYKHRK